MMDRLAPIFCVRRAESITSGFADFEKPWTTSKVKNDVTKRIANAMRIAPFNFEEIEDDKGIFFVLFSVLGGENTTKFC